MSAEQPLNFDQEYGSVAVLEPEQPQLEAPIFIVPIQREGTAARPVQEGLDPEATGFQPAANTAGKMTEYMHLEDIQKAMPAPLVEKVAGVDVEVVNAALEQRANDFRIFGLRPSELAVATKDAYMREHAAEIPDGDLTSAPTEVAEIAQTLKQIADEELVLAHYRFTRGQTPLSPLTREATPTDRQLVPVEQRMLRQLDGELEQVLTTDLSLDDAKTEEVAAALRHQLEAVKPDAQDAFAQEVALMAAIRYVRTRSYKVDLPKAA